MMFFLAGILQKFYTSGLQQSILTNTAPAWSWCILPTRHTLLAHYTVMQTVHAFFPCAHRGSKVTSPKCGRFNLFLRKGDYTLFLQIRQLLITS